MMLQADDGVASTLKPGSVYRVKAGGPDAFGNDARAVWAYIQQAIQAPIGLVLLPPTSTQDAPPLAELGQHKPTGESCDNSSITLFTSGTTGEPKPVVRSLDQALSRKKPSGADGRWLLTFAPFRWAGLSVMLHVFKSKAKLVVADRLEPGSLIAAAKEHQATHVSLTPSYLRRLQLSSGEDALRKLSLEQITFGGEAASQAVLDTAEKLWPNARITHIYATTEHQDLCAVSDGLAGIPENKLADKRFTFTDEGELLIDGHPTGDLWRHDNNRYHFTGRREEIINVGGAKVSPFDVEAAATGLPGVIEARAYAVPSPLLGQMVALDFRGVADEMDVRRQLLGLLPKIACPGVVNRVDEIALTDAGKTQRIQKD